MRLLLGGWKLGHYLYYCFIDFLSVFLRIAVLNESVSGLAPPEKTSAAGIEHIDQQQALIIGSDIGPGTDHDAAARSTHPDTETNA